MLLLILTLTLFETPLPVTAKTFEAPPDGLANPRQTVAIGNELFLLDTKNHCIFVWDIATGEYLRHIGQKGYGPGEFAFEDTVGVLYLSGQEMIIIDEIIKKVHYWSLDGQYKRTAPLPGHFTRIISVVPRSDGNLVVYDIGHRDRKLLLVDADLNILDEISRVNEAPYILNKREGWDYHPYAAKIVYALHGTRVWVGSSNSNALSIYDGKLTPTGQLPLFPAEIPPDEMQYYQDLYAKWRRDIDTITFPEEGATIDGMTMLNGSLVTLQRNARLAKQRFKVFNPETLELQTSFTLLLPEMEMITASGGYLFTAHGEDLELTRWSIN